MPLLYRVRTTLQYGTGGPGLSTHYFAVSGAGSAGDATIVAGRVRGAWDVIKSIMGATQTFTVQPVVDQIDTETGELQTTYAITPPALVTGTSGAHAGPTSIGPGLILDSGFTVNGRREKARTFLVPISYNYTQDPQPVAGVITAVNAMGVALVGSSPPLALPIQVWRRPRKNAAGAITEVGVSYDVAAAYCSPNWWILRSRRD